MQVAALELAEPQHPVPSAPRSTLNCLLQKMMDYTKKTISSRMTKKDQRIWSHSMNEHRSHSSTKLLLSSPRANHPQNPRQSTLISPIKECESNEEVMNNSTSSGFEIHSGLLKVADSKGRGTKRVNSGACLDNDHPRNKAKKSPSESKTSRREDARVWKEGVVNYPIEGCGRHTIFAHLTADEKSLFQRYYHLTDYFVITQKILEKVLSIFNCTLSGVISGKYKCSTINIYVKRIRVWVFMMDRQIVRELSNTWCRVFQTSQISMINHIAAQTKMDNEDIQQWFDGTGHLSARTTIDLAITAELKKRLPEYTFEPDVSADTPVFKHHSHYNSDKDAGGSFKEPRHQKNTQTANQMKKKAQEYLTQQELKRVEAETELNDIIKTFDLVAQHGFSSSFSISPSLR